MRINAFVARATGLSRRAADQAVADGRVLVNGQPADLGYAVQADDAITLDNQPLKPAATTTTIMLNKPAGYICSRQGQGNPTIYDLLPAKYHTLKPVGRLDKDSTGLLLLTDDGVLANRLTHPRYSKDKLYQVTLNKPLAPLDSDQLEKGVQLEDGPSRLHVESYSGSNLTISLSEGRNRQVRRTFAALGYNVTKLHRTHFSDYSLGDLPAGAHREQT